MFYNPLFAKRIPLPFLLAFAFTVYADQPMPETDLIDEISTLYLQRFPEKVISAEEVTKNTRKISFANKYHVETHKDRPA